MPDLETNRLLIRPFVMEDLQAAHHLFDVESRNADLGTDKMETLAERLEWLQWAVRNPVQLAKLHQPPYGDRATVLRSSQQLIGACGFVRVYVSPGAKGYGVLVAWQIRPQSDMHSFRAVSERL